MARIFSRRNLLDPLRPLELENPARPAGVPDDLRPNDLAAACRQQFLKNPVHGADPQAAERGQLAGGKLTEAALLGVGQNHMQRVDAQPGLLGQHSQVLVQLPGLSIAMHPLRKQGAEDAAILQHDKGAGVLRRFAISMALNA